MPKREWIPAHMTSKVAFDLKITSTPRVSKFLQKKRSVSKLARTPPWPSYPCLFLSLPVKLSYGLLKSSYSKCGPSGLAASAPPGSLLEMWSLEPYPMPPELELNFRKNFG